MMSRNRQLVLWIAAACVGGVIGIRVLVVAVSNGALAQSTERPISAAPTAGNAQIALDSPQTDATPTATSEPQFVQLLTSKSNEHLVTAVKTLRDAKSD